MIRRVRLDIRNAAERLAAMPPGPKRRIKEALRQLASDPTGIAHELDVKELRPTEAVPRAFRARIGEWRIVFVVTPREIAVLRIFSRSEGYGWMEGRSP